jgi:hypothetical protein
MTERFCGEILAPFIDKVQRNPGLAPIQVIGGNGSAALAHPGVVINTVYKTIEAPADCNLPQHRPDGTLRDADILVLDSRKAAIGEVDAIAQATIRGLEISVFGLKGGEQLNNQAVSPLLSTAKVFLGDRYVTGRQEATIQLERFMGEKALFPFAVPITGETLETYSLIVDGTERIVPTSHPAATILNYLTRSISGLRTKDAEKVGKLADNVLRSPEMLEWIMDGPGRSTFELARILHTLRESRSRPKVLEVGEHLKIEPLDLSRLDKSKYFMYGSMGSFASRSLVQAAHLKGRALHIAESQQRIVTWWQSKMERRVGGIVHNS